MSGLRPRQLFAVYWATIRRASNSNATRLRTLCHRQQIAFVWGAAHRAAVTPAPENSPDLGEWQLNKSWGDSSPMNVVWSFMGAMLAVAVMTNVVMLNYCYDVPVKLCSTNLLMMGVVILAPDIHRLASVLLFNRSGAASLVPNVWFGSVLRWVRIALKVAVIGFGLAWPIWQHAGKNYDYLYPEGEVAAEAEEGPSAKDERPLLVRRGHRWINEVPFNR
ncbi:MAG: hypothetical protein ACI89X_003765 [Planctomycetota bacterium]|jgi:hypothetical protein